MESPIQSMFGDQLVIETGSYLTPACEGFFDTITDKGLYVTIKGFPVVWFKQKIKRKYHTTRIENFFDAIGIKMWGKQTIQVHKFFLPELIFLLDKFHAPRKIKDEIIANTWVKSMYSDTVTSDVDMSRVERDMNVKLLPWQDEFVRDYGVKKKRCQLRGMILSFDCGLGKTITSLALMKSLGVEKVVIFAPKSTLVNVWVDHLNRFFKKTPSYWVVNQDNKSSDVEYYICNYESMEKIYDVIKDIKKSNKIGIITDESHNFLRLGSKRTQLLMKLRDDMDAKECLLMSGTPLRATGIDCIPLLRIIDNYFDDAAQVTFAKAFGLNTTIAADILHARLDMMMIRRTKEEVLQLPEKYEEDILVKIPDGKRYTIASVKKTLQAYQEERQKHHAKLMPTYEQEWRECIGFLTAHKQIGGSNDFRRYLDTVDYLRRHGYSRFDARLVEDVIWMNKYEKEVLMPAMSKEPRDKFKHCKSAIKYLDMKIQGEVLGYLGTLRGEMTSAILHAIDIEEMIDSAIKKTIFFTSFVDTVEQCAEIVRQKGYTPCLIYGGTSKDVPNLLKQFKTDKKVNPLIATMQTLSTGVTLTEANQVIFVNRPWRQADYVQSSDRVHRIGADTECFIKTLTLDTGEEPNLSTSMKDILDWSRELNETIVDGKVVNGDTPSILVDPSHMADFM